MNTKLLAVLTTAMLVVAACSSSSTTVTAEPEQVTPVAGVDVGGDDSTAEPEEPAPTAERPQPTPVPTSTPRPDPIAPSPSPSVWGHELLVGDCFNSAEPDPAEQQATSEPGPKVDCEGEHEYEVVFVGSVADDADAPFPTRSTFADGLFADHCVPAVREFGGADWTDLPFGTTIWTPTESGWADGDRSFACTAEAGLRGENIYKMGTAAGGTRTSEEGIVARATVDGQRDYHFSFQASTLYPLTAGTWELPNSSASSLSSGLLFASPEQGDDSGDSRAYDLDYETLEVTELATGLVGWEIASPLFVLDLPAFAFAARETADDDWDIFLSRSADDVVAIAESAADDRWPTLTPAGDQIVYHSDGDIWIMNIDGTNKRQLTTDPGGDFESAVSPDGTKIAFSSDRSGNDDIWIMNIDGSDQRNLTNHPAAEAWPFFSHDGETIYFQTDRLGVRSNIMMMGADGSDVSYYSFEFMTNGVLLPDGITARFTEELSTIAEVQSRNGIATVPGSPNEATAIRHSTERLSVRLPGGWEYREVPTDDVASLVASTSVEAFASTWAVDGVLLTVIEAQTADAFAARLDEAAAANDSSCTFDLQDVALDGSRTTTRRDYDCGQQSRAVVVGVYQSDAGLGLLFEGQWDGDPSDLADEELITRIGTGVQWR